MKKMSHSRPQNANWIHECINLVRNRRSSYSDLDRICRIMFKCHGVSHEETVRDLERMVNTGVVSRRAFKGVISYRNHGGKATVNTPGRSARVGRWIHEALKELDTGNGVGWLDIEKWIMTTHPYYHNMKGKIKGALKEDLENGKLWQVTDGKYRLLEAAESPERKIPDRSLVCDFCLQTAESNRKGEAEDLLICRDCGNRAHPSCMDYSLELTARIRADGGSWQCIDCKACVICQDSGDPSSLLFCDACDKGYHMQCHTPKLQSMPTGKWACFNCVSTLSPEEVRASIYAPSTFVPSTQVAREEEMQAEQDLDIETDESIIIEETSPTLATIENDPVTEKPKVIDVPDTSPEIELIEPVKAAEKEPEIKSKPDETNVESNMEVDPPLKNDDIATQKTEVEQSNIVSSTGADVKPKEPANDTAVIKKNAFNWEKDDVVNYVKSLGFPEEAMIFAEQEIDGPSLMVMSRTDLLSSLKFKLGPALKIYANVAKLQIRNLPSQ